MSPTPHSLPFLLRSGCVLVIFAAFPCSGSSVFAFSVPRNHYPDSLSLPLPGTFIQSMSARRACSCGLNTPTRISSHLLLQGAGTNLQRPIGNTSQLGFLSRPIASSALPAPLTKALGIPPLLSFYLASKENPSARAKNLTAKIHPFSPGPR